MAEKSFSVKEIQIQGSGTPTIESPGGGNLNVTAATTTFSGTVATPLIRMENSGNPSFVHLGTGGRVGILQTSPGSALEVKGGVRSAQTPANGHIDLKHDGTNGSVTTSTGNFLFYNSNNSGNYIFHTTSSNSSKFTINSSGHLFAPGLNSGSGQNDVQWSSSNGQFIYNASTRLVKTDIENCSYGLAEILKLKPRIYKRTDADNVVEIGLIADEVQSILPEIVATEKKSFFTKNDSDTEIIPSNVDLKRLTVILTKAIQEQQEQIEILKTKVAALEGS